MWMRSLSFLVIVYIGFLRKFGERFTVELTTNTDREAKVFAVFGFRPLGVGFGVDPDPPM